MSAKDAAVQNDSSGSQAGKSTLGKESRSAVGQLERSAKGTPSPTLKVPKLPPSPTLSGRLKSPHSDPGKERKPFSVVPRQVSSENTKDVKSAWTNGSSKRSDSVAKFKEAVSKSVTDLKIQVVVDNHAVKFGDTRSDSSRKTKEPSPKLVNELKVAGSEEDSDARRKHKETSPQFTLSIEGKASGKLSSPTLCSDCRAAAEGAVCFIGNDGRVSACTTRSAVRLCKNLNCAANNPEYFAALAAAPKKYLVSKRHMLKVQPSSKSRGGQPKSPRSDQNSESSFPTADQADLPSPSTVQRDQNRHSKEKIHDTEASGSKVDEKGTSVCHDGASGDGFSFDQDKTSEVSSFQEELEDDNPFIDDDSEYRGNGGSYSGSVDAVSFGSKITSIGGESGYVNDNLHGRRLMSDSQKMQRRSMGVIEKQNPETVRLRKQLIQERKQSGEWMLDYAIEETVQKLAPTGEPKVKILVQAFERLMSHTDEEVANCSDGTRTPENQVPLFRSITFNS